MSAWFTFPRQGRAENASPETTGRAARACDCGQHARLQFTAVARCAAGGVFVYLRPNALGRIEFRRGGWKFIDMHTPMACQEVLDRPATMDRMAIPQQHDRSSNVFQQVHQKGDHLLTTDPMPMRLHMQLDPALARTDAQRAQQIEPLVVVGARAYGRRFATGCPSAFQRTEQRKAAFVGQNQGRSQGAPLFLSAARHSVSSGQSPLHRARRYGVVDAGNSNPNVVTDARHHWDDSAQQSVCESAVSRAPTSSNLPCSLPHMRRASAIAATRAFAKLINARVALISPQDVSAALLPSANDVDCAWSCLAAVQLAVDSRHPVTVPTPAVAVPPTVSLFHSVSSTHYRTIARKGGHYLFKSQ